MTTHDDILTCIADGRLAIERTVAFSMACTLAKVEAMVREMRPTSGPVTIEGGNTADLADLAEMRDLLDGADYPQTVQGLRNALDDVREAEDNADSLDREHAAACLRASRAEVERDKLATEAPALRDEAAKWSREHWRVHGELSILAAELARIDRAIAPLWTGDPSDCIGKRVESVAKAAHVRAETVDSLYDKLRERDAQIAALTPGPWVRLGDMDPGDGEKVLMHDGVVGSAPWLQLVDEATAKYLHATYLWRRLPAGLLTPPATAEAVAP